MTEMNRSEMSSVQGGGWGCFLSGVVTGIGIVTLQPELIYGGIEAGIITC